MNTIALDTLKIVKSLQASGMPANQAEAVAAVMRESTESADLVTRKDLQIELAPIKADMTLLRQELIQLEQRMTIKLGTMLTIAVGAIVALTKLL